jgi:hypothetical protein
VVQSSVPAIRALSLSAEAVSSETQENWLGIYETDI